MGMAIVDELGLKLEDLNRQMLNRLVKEQQFDFIDVPDVTLDNGQRMTLILAGDPVKPENPVFIPNGDKWADHELFLYIETTGPNGDMMIGNYSLLGTAPVVGVLVPEPRTAFLLLLGATVLLGRMRREP
jgi:hypothetical protein